MDQHAHLPTSSLYPSILPQQWQYNAPLSPHTLPPLQGQHGGLLMHSMYNQSLSALHTPTTTTPNTVSTGNGESALRGYHLQGAPYQQPLQSYNTLPTIMPPSSAAMSLPQAVTPTSAPANNRLVPLRPMTSAPPLHLQHDMHLTQPNYYQSPYEVLKVLGRKTRPTRASAVHQLQLASPSGYGLQFLMQDQDIPTRVVGSQGRRGILPSTQGQPSVSATGTGLTILAKDADGKFPCPDCTKTYLNAKHLKRHRLRRRFPFFPRSDIF
jgi:hypothetical protein